MEPTREKVTENWVDLGFNYFEEIEECGTNYLERKEQENPLLIEGINHIKRLSYLILNECKIRLYSINLDNIPKNKPKVKVVIEYSDKPIIRLPEKRQGTVPDTPEPRTVKRIWRHAHERPDPTKDGNAEVNRLKKRVNIRFMPEVVETIREEAKKEGVTQEKWVLEAIALKLNKINPEIQ